MTDIDLLDIGLASQGIPHERIGGAPPWDTSGNGLIEYLQLTTVRLYYDTAGKFRLATDTNDQVIFWRMDGPDTPPLPGAEG